MSSRVARDADDAGRGHPRRVAAPAAAGRGRAPHRRGQVERLAPAHRRDVGPDRRGGDAREPAKCAAGKIGCGALYATARRRTVQALGAVVALYLLLFQTPLLWWIAVAAEDRRAADERPTRSSSLPAASANRARPAAGSRNASRRPSTSTRPATRRDVIFSSGFVFTLREAEVMKAVAVDNGVPAEAILLEEHAANTFENVDVHQSHPRGTRLAAHPAGELAVPHAPRRADVETSRRRTSR